MSVSVYSNTEFECIVDDKCQHSEQLGYCIDMIEIRSEYDEKFMLVKKMNSTPLKFFQKLLKFQSISMDHLDTMEEMI
jgi:hypothetical protein